MKFLEKEHQYVEDGEQYTPVTTFLKYFQEYVDWDEKCRIKAAKIGVPYKQLKAEWEKARNDGASRGTIFHKMMEDKYTGNSTVKIGETLYPVSYAPTRGNVKEDSTLKLEDNMIYTEKMIWSNVYKICGTADLVEVIDGYIHVKDYKTNKELKYEGYFNPRSRKTTKLLGPLSNLDDCNFNLYQVQLNIYMYMLLRHNRHLKMGNMEILHIIFDEEGGYVIDTKPVRDLQVEVRNMFEDFKNKRLPR